MQPPRGQAGCQRARSCVATSLSGRVGYLCDGVGSGGQDCAMGSDGSAVTVLAGKYAEIRPHMGERAWRLYLGSEARAYAAGEGCGLAAGVAVVAAAAGVSRATVA